MVGRRCVEEEERIGGTGSGTGVEAASPALSIAMKDMSAVSSAAMSTSGRPSVTGSIGTSAGEAEEAAGVAGGGGGRRLAAWLVGLPAVETETVRGLVGGLR